MQHHRYEIETARPFAESLIWQLNRDYYQKTGVEAWRAGTVPHHLTSNSMVGKTYADLIFAFLRDLADQGQHHDKVYLLELGAGHGRLAFHILRHLEVFTAQAGMQLPPYCYVLSDIVEDNLQFFQQHPQFQPYFADGRLDVAYFDAIGSQELELRHAGITIAAADLQQPLLAIANYFFDSLPNDLFYFKDGQLSSCTVALTSAVDPTGLDEAALFAALELVYDTAPLARPGYENPIFNSILAGYRQLVFNTFLLFPRLGLECLDNLRQLSQKGLFVLSMDKGFHEIHDLEHAPAPKMITHGSVSFSVNYHALGAYCQQHAGTVFFPEFATFNLELGCLLFLPKGERFTETRAAYQRVVNGFGPDDISGLMKFTYRHINDMDLPELIGVLRMGGYDSTLFKNVLPRLKQLSLQVTFNERTRLAQTLHQIWGMYFTLNEPADLAFEIGGLLYALAYYDDAVRYFQYSTDHFGHTPDSYYNRILCYYQLRHDQLFSATLREAQAHFPDFAEFAQLEQLDLGA